MTLLVNARILTMDAAGREIERGWLRTESSRIAALGEGAAPAAVPGEEIVDCGGDLLMPGMVNSHCHLAMSLFRGLGEDVDDRLYRYILPLEKQAITARTVRVGTALAALELIRAGVTTVADMYYFEHEVGRVLDRAGLRGLLGQTLGNFGPPDSASFDESFALTEALAEAYSAHPRLIASIAPHATYSTDVPVMARVADWAAAHPGVPVQIHLAETEAESEWAAREHGCSPVGTVEKAGLLRPGLIAAHCLNVSEADIALMAARGVGVAHNPRSNGKAGRGIAPVEAMRACGIPTGIATDGAMSGNTLDLFAQFAPASMFAKLLGHSRRPLPAREVVRMATIEAAQVLGLAGRIGSLEPGKQADLIRISLADPRLHPIWDIHSMLVFATLPSDVQDVMCAGRWLMRGRQVLTLEPAAVMADARQVAAEFGAIVIRSDGARA